MVGRRLAWKRRDAAPVLVAAADLVAIVVIGMSGLLGARVAVSHAVAALALFALAGAVPVCIGGWRSSLAPIAVAVALPSAGPLLTVAAATLAAALIVAVRDRTVGRALGAALATGGPAAVGAAAFVLLHGGDPAALRTLGAVAAATTLFCGGALVSGWYSERPEEGSLLGSAASAGVGGLVAAATGLALVRLYELGPGVPALVSPLLIVVVVGAHRLALRQHEHAQLGRLTAASARTTGLRSFESAVAQAAGEAGPLVGGSVALSLAMGEEATPVCSVVDAAGVRPGSPDLISDMLDWVLTGPRGEVDADLLPEGLRALMPGAGAVVTAGTFDVARPGSLAVVVVRGGRADRHETSRAALLETYVSHAALIATNALLFQRVEAALRDQVDMNRQKDEFLAAVSHELRTPLASMLGSVETLRRLDGRMTPDSRERFFTIAHRQGKRLQRLIEELLLTASLDHRQELVVATSCSLAEMLEEVAVDLALQADERIHVRCEPGAETISTDPNKIRQVVTNLVENATKYAPDGVIEVSAAPRGGRVEIAVIDHGPGIAAADRERAFERFVQLDGSSTRAQGGTGLGLYLCRRVADLLEAGLTLAETPGGGATFVLSLPMAHSATPSGDDPGPTAPGLAASPFGDRDRFRAGPYLDRSLLDLTRGPSSGPAAGLAARPVVPSGLGPTGEAG